MSAPAESGDRRTRIEELLAEELIARGILEPGEVLGRWMCLIQYHATDEDGDDSGGVMTVHSDPQPCVRDQLGLLEFRRVVIQAAMVDQLRRDTDG
jgi:hypothetical protein